MKDADLVRELHEREMGYPGDETLDPERYAEIKHALLDDLGSHLTNPSILILGSFDDHERTHLTYVKNTLSDHAFAFFLDDILETWDFWTTKFKVVVEDANVVLGVFEHSIGGHAWEAGYIDHHDYRDRTYLFKRDYADEDTEYANFDGMFAHYVRSHETKNHCIRWEFDSNIERTAGDEENLPAEITDELDTCIDWLLDDTDALDGIKTLR